MGKRNGGEGKDFKATGNLLAKVLVMLLVSHVELDDTGLSCLPKTAPKL